MIKILKKKNLFALLWKIENTVCYSLWQLVVHCQNLQVELRPEAEKLIHGYYMASRRARTLTQGVEINLASIKLL